MIQKNIIPRWEWRTFGNSFGTCRELIENRELGNYKKNREIYILSKVSGNNVKIRNQTVEVKTLQTVNDIGLEQWCPAMKARFPLSRDELTLVGRYLGVKIPSLSQPTASLESFLRFADLHPAYFRTVKVEKSRYIYVIDQCIVEYVNLSVEGLSSATVCVEHTDAKQVTDIVNRMGLGGRPNTSYVKELKKITSLNDVRKIREMY